MGDGRWRAEGERVGGRRKRGEGTVEGVGGEIG